MFKEPWSCKELAGLWACGQGEMATSHFFSPLPALPGGSGSGTGSISGTGFLEG